MSTGRSSRLAGSGVRQFSDHGQTEDLPRAVCVGDLVEVAQAPRDGETEPQWWRGRVTRINTSLIVDHGKTQMAYGRAMYNRGEIRKVSPAILTEERSIMAREAERPFERAAPADFDPLPDLPDDYGLLADALVARLDSSLHDESGRSLVRLALVVRAYLDALDACGAPRFVPDAATCLDRLRRAEATLRHATAPVLSLLKGPEGANS